MDDLLPKPAHSSLPPVMGIFHGKLAVLKQIKLLPYSKDQSRQALCDDHLFVCVADGWGELASPEGKLLLDYGKLVHLSPGSPATIQCAPGYSSFRAYHVIIERLPLVEQSSAHRMFRKSGGHELPSGEIPVQHPHQLLQMLHELEQSWNNAGDFPHSRQAMLEAQFRQLLPELFSNGQDVLQHQEAGKLEQIRAHLQANYMNPMRRDELAAKAGLNPEYFSAWFKKAAGIGFSAYVNQLRIAKAKELLLAPGRSIQDTAHAIGYPDAFYFSRKFKAIVGESPTSYAARAKRIVAFQHTGHLLALGIQPVGAMPTYLDQWGIAHDQLANTSVIREQFDLEEIAALRPDLICSHQYIDSSQLQQLRELACTTVIPYNQHHPFEILAMLADLLGKQSEAERFRQRYVAKGERIRQQLKRAIQPGETVAYYEVRPPYIWLLDACKGRGIYNLYHLLGLSAPAALQRDVLDKEQTLRIEPGQLAPYAADHMLVGIYDFSGKQLGSPGNAATLLEQYICSQLPDSHAHRIHVVDLQQFAPSDCWSLYHQLDIQADLLLNGIK